MTEVRGNSTGHSTRYSFLGKDASNFLGTTSSLQASCRCLKASCGLRHAWQPTHQSLGRACRLAGNSEVRHKSQDAGSDVLDWVLRLDTQVVVASPLGEPDVLGLGSARTGRRNLDLKRRHACRNLFPRQLRPIHLISGCIRCTLTTCHQGPVDRLAQTCRRCSFFRRSGNAFANVPSTHELLNASAQSTDLLHGVEVVQRSHKPTTGRLWLGLRCSPVSHATSRHVNPTLLPGLGVTDGLDGHRSVSDGISLDC